MSKPSPLQNVKKLFGSKEQLIAKVIDLLTPGEGESREAFSKRLKYVANAKLLRLAQVGEKIKSLGGREALVAKLAELKGQAKDKDFVASLQQHVPAASARQRAEPEQEGEAGREARWEARRQARWEAGRQGLSNPVPRDRSKAALLVGRRGLRRVLYRGCPEGQVTGRAAPLVGATRPSSWVSGRRRAGRGGR